MATDAGSSPRAIGWTPPPSSTGLPAWFYVFALTTLILSLSFPYRPVKYTLAATYLAVCLSFFSRAPERILFVFLLAMPILDLLPPGLFVLPGLNVETAVVLGLGVAAAVSRRRFQPEPAPANPFVAPALFYVAVLSISATRSLVNGIAAWETDHWVPLDAWELFSGVKNRVAFVFLAPIAFRLVWTRGHLRTTVRLVAAITTLVSLQAFWETRGLLGAGLSLESNRTAGLVGTQPNLFGGWLAMMTAFFLPLALSKGVDLGERLLYAATVFAAGTTLIFTLSRGAWLALLVALAVLALFRGARIVVLLLLLAATAEFWLPDSAVQRAKVTTEGTRGDDDQVLDDSAQVRLDQWKALPEILAASPLLGHGQRSFQSVWAEVGPSRRPKSAHSSLVELTSEEGLAGLASYLWLVGTLATAGWRLRKRRDDPFLSEIGAGFFASVICLVILDTSGTRFRNPEVMAYMWVLGGAILRMVREGSSAFPAGRS